MKSKLLVLCLATLTLVGCNNSKPEPKPDPTEPTSITLSDNEETLINGVTTPYTLTATVLPETAIDKSVTWTSSDPSIVEVVDGKCYAKSIGDASITAKTCNGLTATCEFKVSEPFNFDMKSGDTVTNAYVGGKTVVLKLDSFVYTTSIIENEVSIVFNTVTWTCVSTTDTSAINSLWCSVKNKNDVFVDDCALLARIIPQTTEEGKQYTKNNAEGGRTLPLSDAPYTYNLVSYHF